MRLTTVFLLILCCLEVFSQKPDSLPILTIHQLMNCKYNFSQNESNFDSTLRLKNGFHYYPNQYGVIDSASYTEMDDRMVAFGDLNNDGIKDAAVIFYYITGGSGCYLYLVAVHNINGKPKSVASVGLGDRVQVKGIVIKNGIIELKMLSHDNQGGQCCPTRKTAPKFKIKGNIMSEITGVNFH